MGRDDVQKINFIQSSWFHELLPQLKSFETLWVSPNRANRVGITPSANIAGQNCSRYHPPWHPPPHPKPCHSEFLDINFSRTCGEKRFKYTVFAFTLWCTKLTRAIKILDRKSWAFWTMIFAMRMIMTKLTSKEHPKWIDMNWVKVMH